MIIDRVEIQHQARWDLSMGDAGQIIEVPNHRAGHLGFSPPRCYQSSRNPTIGEGVTRTTGADAAATQGEGMGVIVRLRLCIGLDTGQEILKESKTLWQIASNKTMLVLLTVSFCVFVGPTGVLKSVRGNNPPDAFNILERSVPG